MRPRISNEEDGLVTVLKTLKTKVNLVAMFSGYNQPLSESPLEQTATCQEWPVFYAELVCWK